MRILKIVFNVVLTILSFLVPKSKKYIIVGGWYGKRYADNSKAIYVFLNNNKEKLGIKRVIWITKSDDIYKLLKNKNLDVVKGYSISAIFWHLRSKTHIIDQNPHDILGFLSVRCNRINLWHGFPLKRIGNLITNSEKKVSFWDKLASGGFWADQTLLATSEMGAELLSRAMGIKREKCVIASYPRTCNLFKDYSKKINSDIFRVLYLPTLRDRKERNPILDSDLTNINIKLKENNIVFLLKPHPASIGDWSFINDLSNFQILKPSEDIYNILEITDLLITDYSSVHFDYMLTGKALLFFPYDYEDYISKDRGFNLPYDEFTPGAKVYKVNDLIEGIVKIKLDYAGYQKQYRNQYRYINDLVNKYQEKPDYRELLDIIC